MNTNNVDNKIVQMTFDNKKFEQNAQATLKTLDKLKEHLQFDKTCKELEKVQRASDSLTFKNIESNLQKLVDLTTLPGRAFDKLFTDIANKAVETGERIVKALTIEPRMDGFKEYENKINSIQVIAANTGVLMRDMEKQLNGTGEGVWGKYDWTKSEIQAAEDIWYKGTYGNGQQRIDSLTDANYDYVRVQAKVNDMLWMFNNEGEDCGLTIEDIEAGLEELNKYADDTIYSFSDMTRAIGQFTTAGVDFYDSVVDVKGIANLGALVGATSQQVGNIQYQLSQGLASGSIVLRDWMSLENAGGMGGKIFQDVIMETARHHGIDIDGLIEQYGKFRLTLQEGWFTADILNESLAKLSGDYDKQYWLDLGYTEQAADDIVRLGMVAQDSATKVKTWTQFVEASKEALGTQWAETWEILIGDYYEAPKLLTRMAQAFADVVKPIGQLRNSILSMWSTLGGREYLIEGFANLFHVVKNVVTNVGEAIYAAMGSPQAYTIARFLERISKAFYDFTAMLRYGTEVMPSFSKVLQTLFNIGRVVFDGIKWAATTVIDLFKELWEIIKKGLNLVDFGGITDTILAYSMILVDWVENAHIFEKAHDAIIAGVRKVPDIFGKAVSAIKNFFNTIKNGIKTANEWIENKTGFNVIKTFETIGMVIVGVIWMIIDAIAHLNFDLIWPALLAVPSYLLDGLIKVKEFFEDITGISKKTKESLDETGETVKEHANIMAIITDPVKQFIPQTSILTKALEAIKEVFVSIGTAFKTYGLPGIFSILASGSAIAAFVKIRDTAAEFKDLIKPLVKIGNSASKVLLAVKDVLKAYSFEIRAKALKLVAEAALMLAGAIWALSLLPSDKVNNAAAAIGILLGELLGVMRFTVNIGKLIALSVALMAMSGAIVALTVVGLVLSLLPEKKIANGMTVLGEILFIFVVAFALLCKASKQLTGGQLLGLAAGIVAFAIAINLLIIPLLVLSLFPYKKLQTGFKALAVVLLLAAGALAIVGLALWAFSKMIQGTSKQLVQGQGLDRMHTYVIQLSIGLLAFASAVVILSVALIALSLVPADKLSNGLKALGLVMLGAALALGVIAICIIGVAKAMSKINPSQFKTMTPALLALAITITVFVAALLVLSVIPLKLLIKSTAALVVLLFALAGSFKLMNGVTMDTKKMLGLLLAFSMTVGILVGLLIILGGLDTGKLIVGMVSLLIVITSLVVALNFIGNIVNKIDDHKLAVMAQALMAFTFSLVAVAIVLLSMAYAAKMFKKAGPGAVIAILIALVVILGSLVAIVALVVKFGSGANARALASLGMIFAGFGIAALGIAACVSALAKLIKAIILLNDTPLNNIGTRLTELLSAVIQNIGLIKEIINDALEFIGELIGTWFTKQILIWCGIIKAATKPIIDATIYVLTEINNHIQEITELCLMIIVNIIYGIDAKIDDIVEALVILIIDLLYALGDSLDSHAADLADALIGVVEAILKVLWELISQGLSELFNWISDLVDDGLRKISKMTDPEVLGGYHGFTDIEDFYWEKFHNVETGQRNNFQMSDLSAQEIRDYNKAYKEWAEAQGIDLYGTDEAIEKTFSLTNTYGQATIKKKENKAASPFSNLLSNFKTGFKNDTPGILNVVDDVTTSIKNKFDSKKDKMFDVTGMGEKLKSGLESELGIGAEGISLNAIKEKLGIGGFDMGSMGDSFNGITQLTSGMGLDASNLGISADNVDLAGDLNASTASTRGLSSGISSDDKSTTRITDSISSLGNKLSELIEPMKRLTVVLDTGALVGSLADPLDEELGKRASARSRGV